MNRNIISLVVILLALFLFAGAFAEIDCSSYLEYGKAVAGLSGIKGVSEDALASRLLLRSKKPMTNLDEFDPLAVIAGPQNHYTVQFSTADEAQKCMESLEADENVIYVQQDSPVSAYGKQDSLAVSKADPYLSWGAKAMGADDLAASVTASGSVTVAVVDSGVKSHPFLDSRVKTGGVDFTSTAYTDGRHDVNGHGTHVAGTIVDLTQGLKVNILPVRVLGDEGTGAISAVCNGIRYAADSGAKVINMSLGGQLIAPYAYNSEQVDAINYAVGKGVTIVVAAGNETMDTAFSQPACFDNVIVVAAINSSYKIADFSNFGDSVDVCAPGVNITSCSINGGFVDYNGTSMASPHVAAVAAMVKLQNPRFSPARVENYIKSHCMDLGADGWDRVFGCGMPCFVENEDKPEGDFTYKINSDGAIVTGYTGTAADVVIPDKLGGFAVAGIEQAAFKENASIVSLAVPGTVKEIGNFSFSGCTMLKTVDFKEGLIRIGDNAFSGCAALESVALPKTLKNLGGEAFKACAALKSIELPKDIEAMGKGALSETAITSFTVPASLGCVPASTFAGCVELESVVIEQGVKRIDSMAFSSCMSLQSISVPKSVTSIGDGAFSMVGLTELKLPGVKSIASYAFFICPMLDDVELSDSLETIASLSFLGCAELGKITIPRTIKEIGPLAFIECPKATLCGYKGCTVFEEFVKDSEVTIAHEYIGYMYPLTKLTSEYPNAYKAGLGDMVWPEQLYSFEPSNATEMNLDWTTSDKSVFDYIDYDFGGMTFKVFSAVGKGECTVTGTAKDGSCLSVSIKMTVGDPESRNVRLSKNELTLKVGGSEKLAATVRPEGSVQSIVWTSDNPAIATVGENGEITALSAGVATITAQSKEYPELSDICLVTVVSTAPVKAEFKYAAIDDKTASITGYTGGEKDIVIPSVIDGLKIVHIEEKAFFKSNIESVTIPEGVTVISEKAFADCTKLKSATLPESLATLAFDAFKGCKSLPKVKSIELDIMMADDGFILRPVFTPANTASAYTVSLSKKKSADVGAMGLITPKTDDYFSLTVKAGGKKAVLGVSGGEPYAAAKVSIDGKAKRSVKLGKTLQLSYKVKPETARVVATWTTSDDKIAAVDQSGLVTPVAAGKVTITLTTDIGLSDSVTVTVK